MHSFVETSKVKSPHVTTPTRYLDICFNILFCIARIKLDYKWTLPWPVTKPLVPSMGSSTLILSSLEWPDSRNKHIIGHDLFKTKTGKSQKYFGSNFCVHPTSFESNLLTTNHPKSTKLAQGTQTRSWPSSASKPASMLVKKSSRVKSPPDEQLRCENEEMKWPTSEGYHKEILVQPLTKVHLYILHRHVSSNCYEYIMVHLYISVCDYSVSWKKGRFPNARLRFQVLPTPDFSLFRLTYMRFVC